MSGWRDLKRIKEDASTTELATSISASMAQWRSHRRSDRHRDADTAEPCVCHACRTATADGSLRQHSSAACVRILRQQHDTRRRSRCRRIADDRQCADTLGSTRLGELPHACRADGSDVGPNSVYRRITAVGLSRLLPQPSSYQRFYFRFGDSHCGWTAQIPAGYFTAQWQHHPHSARSGTSNLCHQYEYRRHRYCSTAVSIFCAIGTGTAFESSRLAKQTS